MSVLVAILINAVPWAIRGVWGFTIGRWLQRNPAPPIKSVVPPDHDPDFVGRKAKIEQVVDKLTKGKTGVYIQGGPGIGKSALARQVVNEKKVGKKFKKGVVWIDLTDENLGQVCNRVASALNIRQVQETESEADKVAALRAALEKSSHLVVLDNADGPLAPMAQRFAEDVTRRVLVTSRDSLPGLDEVSLGPMPPDEAVDLLVAKGPETLPADQRALLPRIARMVEYSPLALELAAGQLVGMHARELIDSLNKRLLDPLFAPNDEGKAVRAVIDTSYERLSEDGKRLMAALGAFGGGFSPEAVQALAERDPALGLSALVRCSLLDYDRQNGRYRLHSLVREYCREKLEEWSNSDQNGLYKRMASHYSEYAQRHHQPNREDYDALELERPNIFALLEWHRLHGPRDDKGWAALVVDLNISLTQFLDVRGFWGQRIAYGDVAVECAESLGIDARLAVISHSVAISHHDRGEIEEAERLYRRSLEIGEKLGAQQGIAATLHQLGMLARDKRNYLEAEGLYRRSLEIEGKLGNQKGMAATLHQLGMMAQDRENYSEAEGLYRRSLEIQEKLGNQQGIAQSLHQLGRLAHIKRDDSEAEKLYRRSLEIAEKLGSQEGIAINSSNLGLLKEATGDLPEAREFLRRALAIFERLGSPNAERVKRHLERVEQRLGPRGSSSSSPSDA